MKIIIAPQGFKGSLPAHEAAQAIEKGVKAFDKSITAVLLPVADGGAGTVRALVAAAKGKIVTSPAHGPLGDKVNADWGLSGDGKTAFIEVAAASGLSLVPASKLDPMRANTYGAGELIRAALKSGCRNMIIGLGDSATVDGGMGIAAALGVRFLDDKFKEVPPGGAGLALVKHIDISGRNPLVNKCCIRCACDVTNPLYGRNGAAYVYGPQKGATPEMVDKLDAGLRHLADVIQKGLGHIAVNVPGAGAAGGLGAGLFAFLGASLEPGVDLICDAIGFDGYLKDADLVITGEGRIDSQTAFGKTVIGIAQRAKALKKPVIAICGTLGDGYEAVYQHGISKAVGITPPGMTKEDAMRNAAHLLKDAAEKVVREWMAGKNSKY
jgi:glycerate 2-kinase